jgi:Na+/H+-dicarboxylate symporter
VALFGARIPLGRFTRAIAPAQAVAFSTQSSLAPLCRDAAALQELGVPAAASGVSLPMAVACSAPPARR